MLHIPPTNYHFLAAKQEQYPNVYLLTKTIEESFFGEKSRANEPVSGKRRDGKRNGSRQKKKRGDSTVESNDNNEGVDRRTREEIVQWNQMTTLRFQTRGRHHRLYCGATGKRRRYFIG